MNVKKTANAITQESWRPGWTLLRSILIHVAINRVMHLETVMRSFFHQLSDDGE